jgi:hypothetical protein
LPIESPLVCKPAHRARRRASKVADLHVILC